MSIKRTICGIEWRVFSPSLYVFDSFDDPDDSAAVHYDPSVRCWRITTRHIAFTMEYASRDSAMATFAEHSRICLEYRA